MGDKIESRRRLLMERGFQWKWMLRENVGYYQNQVVRIDDTDFVLKYALGAHQSE